MESCQGNVPGAAVRCTPDWVGAWHSSSDTQSKGENVKCGFSQLGLHRRADGWDGVCLADVVWRVCQLGDQGDKEPFRVLETPCVRPCLC
jgi:hypothetical protein